ncbi:MAG: protein kinase [Planctomycetes bacterium]|nr:protein kinase [Planctomycetota bacterium]
MASQRGLGLEPGQFFGERFQILSLLGQGAMGVVYQARDHQTQREVALKILSSSANESIVARFVREGELTAALRHPGIVTVYSGGAVGQYPYLAYELVADARTLDDVLPTLSIPERAALLLQVAEAVGFAHDQGIFHRDLKPENVLVTPEGAPRVADFGLASGRELDRLTKSGTMIGTPSYMSPEAISGKRSAIGAPSDVWSLGVILYEGLTGQLPFGGDSLLSLAANVMRDDPRPLRSIDSSIPAGLETVCLAALRRAPEQRYPDANALAQDLGAALRGERPSVGSSNSFERALGTQGSRRRRTLTLAALAAGPLLALTGGIWFATRTPSPPPIATPIPTVSKAATDPKLLAHQGWVAIRRERDPSKQLSALETWLTANPEAEDREQAIDLARLRAGRQALSVFPHPRVELLAFDGPERLLSVGHGELRAWDLAQPSQEPIWRTRFPSAVFYGAVYLREQQFLVSNGSGVHWISRTYSPTPIVKGARGVLSIAYHPATQLVALGRNRGDLIVGRLDFSSTPPRFVDRRDLSTEFDYFRSLTFSPDGRYVATGAGHGKRRGRAICIWDLTSEGRAPSQVITLGFDPELITFTPSGTGLLVGDDGGALHGRALKPDDAPLHGYASLSVQKTVKMASNVAHMGRITGLVFTHPDRFLTCSRGSKLIGDGGNSLSLWDLNGGERRRLLVQPIRWRCMTLGPKGDRLALGREGEVEVRSGWLIR